VVVMMMVVVVVVVPVAMRHDDDDGPPVPTVMVMMVVMMELGKLNVVLRRRLRDLFIDRLQHRLGVRDRLQQIGE
jgi:hypothetical protein